MNDSVANELREILAHYDLGELVDCQKNERCFVNTSYEICMLAAGERKRFFLRKYKPGIGEEELRFEHSLIEHLVEAGAPVARIHHTTSGESFFHGLDAAGNGPGAFYTVFDFLPGEDRFTWVDPRLTDAQLRSSAAVLAALHLHAGSFVPKGRRIEPKILELLPVIAETWSGCPGRSKGTILDDRIKQHLDIVRGNINATLAAMQEAEAQDLPEMVIHCDYHPGNLKFSGESVSGVFDFDWSKVDLRVFDLGLAIWYFCASWEGSVDGSLRLDAAATFLHAYQQSLALHPEAVTLGPREAHYLPIMINAGNLYVLHWTILDYFEKDVDLAQYLVFLDHSLNFVRWYSQPSNCHALEEMIARVLAPSKA